LKHKLRTVTKDKIIITVECYHGILEEELLPAFIEGLSPVLTVKSTDSNYDHVLNMIDRDVSNFGRCFDSVLEENSLYLKYGYTTIDAVSCDRLHNKKILLLKL